MDVTNIEPVDVEKVAEENPQSRFRILNVPILAPGTCGLCGSPGGDGRQFVDFGKQLDWYGAVYFCTFCVAEAANLLGLAPKSDWTLAEANLQAEISRVDDLYVNTKVQLNAARLLLRNCDCGSPDANGSSADSISVDVESDEQGSDGTSDVDESSGLEGSDDISEATNDDPAPKSRRSRRASSSVE